MGAPKIQAAIAQPASSASDVLELFTDGYPVHIDLAEKNVAGAATGMRFLLPLKGLNLPLMHRFEHKLVVALQGQLQMRSGAHVLARLEEGTALVLPPGVAHRIAQQGTRESVVGVVLWPGFVEQAFRTIAARVSLMGTDKAAMIGIFADHGVVWDAGGGSPPSTALYPKPLAHVITSLPNPVRQAMLAYLGHWFNRPLTDQVFKR